MKKTLLEECHGYYHENHCVAMTTKSCHTVGIQQDKILSARHGRCTFNIINIQRSNSSYLHYYSTFLDDDDLDMDKVLLAPREGQLPI